MNKKIQILRIISILLVLLWMIVVFDFSKEKGKDSSGTSTGLTEKIVDIITSHKKISQEEKNTIIEIVEPIIRKCAHYGLYLIGGFLIINCFNKYNLPIKAKICTSIVLGVLYACTDEIHQYFVPDRSAKIVDVFIDSLGILTGIVFFYILIKIVEYIKLNLKNNEEKVNSNKI